MLQYKRLFYRVVSRIDVNIRIGNNFSLENSAILKYRAKGRIRIGDHVSIRDYVIVNADDGVVEIGSNCSINPYTMIVGIGGVFIGNHCRIASHCVVMSASHVFADPTKPIIEQGITKEGIRIEDDVWIGAGAIILDGVTIGKGSVIAAGSVVGKNVSPYDVMAGAPARILANRRQMH